MKDIYQQLEDLGIDKERLTKAMDSKDNWGALVHAFEYVTTLSVVLDAWPDYAPRKMNIGVFPMHEAGRD